MVTGPDINPPEGWWPAPAKLNLCLHITGRRADGYHLLQTVFQLLDLCDYIRVQTVPDGHVERVGENAGIPEHEDLLVRAARLLQENCRVGQGAKLEIRKNIPLGAGLGGGSSDAATVLHALNQLWRCQLKVDQLAKLGLQLGADVPLFVHGHSAVARGIGEQLSPVSLGRRHYLLVFPGFGISTAEVFAQPDLRRDASQLSELALLQALGENDCEPVARRLCPELDSLMQHLQEFGQPRLTGTGSTIFFGPSSKADCEVTTQQLNSLYNVRAVRGLDRSPLLKMLH